MSLLLTSGKHKYFQTRESWESFDELMEQAKSFDAPHAAMNWVPGDETYDFEHDSKLIETLAELRTRVMPQVDFLRSHDWITSTMVGVGVSKQTYLTVSSSHPGGKDQQYQIRLFAMATGKIGDVTQEYFDSITANDSLEYFSEEHITGVFSKIVERLQALLHAPAAPS